jgi:Fe-Mn family superoxide dismutase
MKLVHTELPYARDDLEPSMSKETIDYHYDELYGGYVKRFNKNEGDADFNEAGAFLHNIYFTQFQSPESSNNPKGPIAEFINEHFKSFSNFKEEFEKTAMAIQGSGWAYLAKNGKIKTITNHQIKNDIVLLVDWWEHAWALDYQADKKGYLTNQWKIINWNVISARVGLTESRSSFSFIQELTEARLLYSENDVRTTYTETCENLYLALLALEFMAHCKETKSVAKKYASETTKWGVEYKEFRTSSTDLYNLIYLVSTSPSRVKHIFKSSEAQVQREKTYLPVMQLNGYLTSLTNTGNRDIHFVMRLEQALSIKNSNSKEIRRLLSYHNPGTSDVMQLSHRLLNEFRNRIHSFDLLTDMEKHLSKALNYDR